MDWTTYFETMPTDKIDLGLRLEADRMTNSIIDPKEVASERTVIISEREGSENEPPLHPARPIPITAASATAMQWRRAAAASLVVTVTSPLCSLKPS